jgi:geranylgeranyl reductase family protein
MAHYDILVVGGGIAGSVAARFAAQNGFETLLIEKLKTPRNKPCSGIQFSYFEKLVGTKIPPARLCENALSKVEIITPKGKVIRGKMKMLNFWRSTFDSWLNSLAVEAGATFCDQTQLVDFHEDGDIIRAQVRSKDGEDEVTTRYLIAADGLRSQIRKKLRPQDFAPGKAGAAVNFYFVGDADLDPDTLYMFYNREFAPLMFAWVYLKDDQWVIGTGAPTEPLKYAERFFNFVKAKYNLRGEIKRREGFSSPMRSEIFLGRENILLAGDAAGLIDLYRGVGMDNAALSARLAIKAIVKSEKQGTPPFKFYKEFMRRMALKVVKNASKQAARYATDNSLCKSLSRLNVIKSGLQMLIAAQLNKILPPDKIITLPL